MVFKLLTLNPDLFIYYLFYSIFSSALSIDSGHLCLGQLSNILRMKESCDKKIIVLNLLLRKLKIHMYVYLCHNFHVLILFLERPKEG